MITEMNVIHREKQMIQLEGYLSDFLINFYINIMQV